MAIMASLAGYEKKARTSESYNNWERDIRCLMNDFYLPKTKGDYIIYRAKRDYKTDEKRYWAAHRFLMDEVFG